MAAKKVVIFIEDFYNELEFWVPYYRLLEAGAQVFVAGPHKRAIHKSKIGMPGPKTDAALGEVDARDMDGLVIPGGYAPDRMRRDPDCLELTRKIFEQGKPVAMICHAGWVPISAGILKGKKGTSFFAIKDDVVNAGLEWVDESVVVDGNLISSRSPDDLPDFCREIVKALGL